MSDYRDPYAGMTVAEVLADKAAAVEFGSGAEVVIYAAVLGLALVVLFAGCAIFLASHRGEGDI